VSDAPFQKLLASLKKDRGMFSGKPENVPRLKVGIAGVDYLFGGGVPLGRAIELYGFEGSGKTTLTAEIARAFQLAGKRVLYLDYEHSVDLSYFRRIGLAFEEELWLYDTPKYMEQGLDAANELVKTGGIGLVVIDSVASMVPKDELEGPIEDYSVGLQARKLGQALRVITGTLDIHKTSIIFINQLRQKIGGNPYELRIDPTTTPGGVALKFYASIRCEMRKVGKDGERFVHRLRLTKQKTAAIKTLVTEFLIGDGGIDRLDHLRRCLVNAGVIYANGSHYFFKPTGKEEERLAHGEEKLKEYFSANTNRLSEFISRLYSVYENNNASSAGP